MSVIVRKGDLNKALRILKKRLTEDGVLQDYKAKQFYEKQSEKRKREKAAGRARWMKQNKKLKQEMGL